MTARRVLALIAALTFSALGGACAGPAAQPAPSPDTIATGTPPPPSFAVDDLPLPSVPPVEIPEGEPEPPPPPSETGDLYAGAPYDAAGYVAAFRAGYPDLEYQYDDAQVLEIGTNLCTYLMRHADANSVVALAGAITEADIHQPGFPRSEWVFALHLANEHYCPEFGLDTTGIEGT